MSLSLFLAPPAPCQWGMLTWRSDIPRWGWGPPALFPADVEVEGPAQERVHGCGSSLLAWLLAHNPEDRGGAEESLKRGTGRGGGGAPSIYRSRSGRRGAGHCGLSKEVPAFFFPLNLDRAIIPRGFLRGAETPLLSAWGRRWAGSELKTVKSRLGSTS